MLRERLICVMNRTSSIDFTSFIAIFNERNDTPNSLQDLRERSGLEPTTVPKSSLLATFALLSFLSFSLSKIVLVLLYSTLLFSFLSVPSRSPLVRRGEDFALLTMRETTFPRARGDPKASENCHVTVA